MDHTADVAIETEATTAGGCLEEAALALTELLAGRAAHTLTPDRELAFRVEAPDLEALAVAFLAELVWLQQAEDALWLGGGILVEQAGAGWSAVARGNGLRHDGARHGRGVEVKAVTYHGVRFERAKAGWALRVVLDL
ncbi:MAG: archease [Candidatus Thermoplasmatota archaeon]